MHIVKAWKDPSWSVKYNLIYGPAVLPCTRTGEGGGRCIPKAARGRVTPCFPFIGDLLKTVSETEGDLTVYKLCLLRYHLNFYSGQSTLCWFKTLHNSLARLAQFVVANYSLTNPCLQHHDRAKKLIWGKERETAVRPDFSLCATSLVITILHCMKTI